MNVSEAKKKLLAIGQEHVLQFWTTLDAAQQDNLLGQIAAVDSALFLEQQRLVKGRKGSSAPIEAIEPVAHEVRCSSKGAAAIAYKGVGRQILEQGAVGALLLAGGHGSRLGFHAPKGCYPISVIEHKSLFQLFAEKTLAASLQAGRPLSLAILCAPDNIQETEDFFADHAFFGLAQEQLFFFCQGELPLLDTEGNLFLEAPGTVALGPEGNGTALYHFVLSGIAEKWRRDGIEYVNLIFIDNPLADPFDATLVGCHSSSRHEVTIKCIERTDPEESVGVIVQQEGALRVIEYNELPEAVKLQRDADGALLYDLANISLFCFSLSFLPDLAEACHKMPFHTAYKRATLFTSPDESSRISTTGVINKGKKADFAEKEPPTYAWKFERYIFDILPWVSACGIVVYPREKCFAPLKSAEGPCGVESVKNALQAADRQAIASITGLAAPSYPFELGQRFHYPTPQLLEQWHRRPMSGPGYIP